MLARDGFGPRPRFRTLIAEWDRAAAGYAICFPIYSTFQGPALFLEDVYMRPQFRDKGIGKAMIGEVAAMACAKDAERCAGKACVESTGHRFL
jgi:GNAT superfamily N-acetyltransferase